MALPPDYHGKEQLEPGPPVYSEVGRQNTHQGMPGFMNDQIGIVENRHPVRVRFHVVADEDPKYP